jgi:hypothetical protein
MSVEHDGKLLFKIDVTEERYAELWVLALDRERAERAAKYLANAFWDTEMVTDERQVEVSLTRRQPRDGTSVFVADDADGQSSELLIWARKKEY